LKLMLCDGFSGMRRACVQLTCWLSHCSGRP